MTTQSESKTSTSTSTSTSSASQAILAMGLFSLAAAIGYMGWELNQYRQQLPAM